jgi:hypothetical protein
VHSAATVLAFLQKERGLLQPGFTFQPITRDAAPGTVEVQKPEPQPRPGAATVTTGRTIDTSLSAKRRS